MPPEHIITACAVAAAILLIGGAILIRLQRDRHHFRLMQMALERGITAFPGVPPGWLISLRIGCLVLVLGIGLVIAGLLLCPPISTSGPIAIGGATAPAPPPPPSIAGDPRSASPQTPPPPNPEMEHQHRIENQHLAGLVCIGAGVILSLLGIVRILFARLERRYAQESILPTTPAPLPVFHES